MLGVAGLDRCVPAITEAYSIAAVPGNPPGSADQGGLVSARHSCGGATRLRREHGKSQALSDSHFVRQEGCPLRDPTFSRDVVIHSRSL